MGTVYQKVTLRLGGAEQTMHRKALLVLADG
jgi:hypothetical protein